MQARLEYEVFHKFYDSLVTPLCGVADKYRARAKIMGNASPGSESPAVVYREVTVRPLAARREALLLIAVLAVIILLMAVRFSAVRVADNESTLKMYQQQDRFLQNQEF